MASRSVRRSPNRVAVVHVMNRRFDETMNTDAWRTLMRDVFAQTPDRRWELLSRVAEGPFVLDHFRTQAGGRSGAERHIHEVRLRWQES